MELRGAADGVRRCFGWVCVLFGTYYTGSFTRFATNSKAMISRCILHLCEIKAEPAAVSRTSTKKK